MKSAVSIKIAYFVLHVLLLIVLPYASGCGENSSDNTDGDYDGGEAELADYPADDRCADVGDEACPAANDCMIFSAVQTAFPECAIYCRAEIINEGLSCLVLDEYGVCSNGRCVVPGQTADGDSDSAACRPEYAEVPECPQDSDCATYEHMWRPSPDCRWLCVALPRNNGDDCLTGGLSGTCQDAQCVPTSDGDAESLPEGDIDGIENERETDAPDGDWEDLEVEPEQDDIEDDSDAGEIDAEISDWWVD